MRRLAPSRLAPAGGLWLLGAAIAIAACSSKSLRDQNYGTDVAQAYDFPDGGYPVDGRQHEAGDGNDEDADGDDGDAGDAGRDAGDAGRDAGIADAGAAKDGPAGSGG
jgi:hypothetical protein